MAPQLLTSVLTACDGALLGQPELLLAVQDFLLPLVELGPEVAVRVGGTRLLALWLEAASLHGAGIDEYTGLALFTAIQQTGELFIERALKADVQPEIWTSVANFAVHHNDRKLLWILHDRVVPLEAPHAIEIAASVGDIELIKWIYACGFGGSVVTEKTLARAAAKANLPIIQWCLDREDLSEKQQVMVRRAMNYAAKYGQFEVLRWLREHTDVWWSPHAIGAAVISGYFEVADWMVECTIARQREYKVEGYDPSPPVVDVTAAAYEAFSTGDLRKLDWLRRCGLLERVTSKQAERAKKAGHVHVLEYIVEHFPATTVGVLRFNATCATGGSIPVAQWALEHKLLGRDDRIVMAAAKNGHIDFIVWYTGVFGTQPKGETDGEALAITAAGGHFECVRFLVEKGYTSVTSSAILSATRNGYLAMAQWLAAALQATIQLEAMEIIHGDSEITGPDILPPRCLGTAMNEAAINGHLEVVKWIHAMKCFSFDGSTLDDAAGNGHLDVVRYLVKHEPEHGTQNATSRAAQHGHLRVVKYLLSHSPQSREVCKLLALQAHENGHKHVAKWIQSYGSR